MSPLVLVDKQDNLAVVTLNRPQSMNALSRELMRELVVVFTELQADDTLAAVVLTGAGKAFCAGLDLEQLSGEGGLEAFPLDGEYDIQAAVLGFDRPVIGAINGAAATGGFELALWCDILVASEQARFIDTHARVGLVPGWGLSQRLQRLIGINRAREVSLAANFLSAEKAEAWGLVNRVVSADQLLPTCLQLAQDIARCDRQTLVRYKRVINEGAGMDLASALKYERLAMDLHSATQSGQDIGARRQDLKK